MQISDLQNLKIDYNSEDGFETIKDLAEDVLLFGELMERKEMTDYLSNVLQNRMNQQYADEYQALWISLISKSFPMLSSDDQHMFLQRRAWFAVQKGFDAEQLMEAFTFIYGDEYPMDMFRGFANDLEQNSETFGSNAIEIEGKKYLPQIKYWILDYSKFPSKSAKRGAIERLGYINQSPNARSLTQGQRQSLLKLLELYDEFVNPEPVIQPAHKVSVPGAVRAKVDIDAKLKELRQKVSQR